MAAADTVSLTYTADVSDLKKKMTEVTGATAAETRKAVKELAKANRAVEKAAKNARQSGKKAADGLKDVGDAAGDSESSLRAIGGVLGMLSPEAERALGSIAEFGGGLEGVTRGAKLLGVGLKGALVVTGAVGAAVAVAAIAYTSMAREIDQARAQAELLHAVNLSLEPSTRALADAELARAVALGHLTTAQAESETQSRSAQRAVLDFAEAQREQRAALEETIESQRSYVAAFDSLIGPVGSALAWGADKVFGFTDSIEDAQGQITTLDRAVQREAGTQKELRAVLADTTAATKKQTSAGHKATEAIKAQTDARRAFMADLAATASAEESLQTLQDDLAAGSDEWARKELAVNRQFAARVKLLDDIATQTGVTAELDAAYIDAQKANEGELLALRQERAEKEREIEEKRREDTKRTAEEEIRDRRMANAATLSSLADLAQASGDAVMAIASASNKASRKGMKAAFFAQKALSLTMVGLKVAEGLVAAQMNPYPLNIIQTATVVATGATSTAMILASKPPQFNDTPGVVQVRGGGAVGVAPGDMVVAGKSLDDMAAQVDRAIDRPAPRVEVVAIPSYMGRTYDRARRDAYRRPGPDRAALNQDRANGPGGW